VAIVVGKLLADALAAAAIHNGTHRFAAIMLGDNAPAQRLMGRLTKHLELLSEAGVTQAETEIAA
jgi:hypothetical protein